MAVDLTIAPNALAAVHAAAQAAHPAEACGLLLGSGMHVDSARAAANVHPAPLTRFEIDPAALLAAHREARAGGPALVGYFHSHPAGHPRPSAVDCEHASGDGRVWAIVAGPEISFWRDGETASKRFPTRSLRRKAARNAPPFPLAPAPTRALLAGVGGFAHDRLDHLDPPPSPGREERALTVAAPSIELASLLCSRLCHDMMSPVGALTNGLELLADEQDPDMRKRCFELLEQSAKMASDKLRFFRLAFGAGGVGPGEPVPVAEAQALVEGLTGTSQRIAVNWVLAGETLPLAAVKTLLNFALIGTQALVRGGQLDLGAEQTGRGIEIVVRASAERIAFDPDVGRALDGSLPEGELTSRTAPAAITHALAASLGGRVQHIKTADSLLLGAELPTA